MTQIDIARSGRVSPEMMKAAKIESLSPDLIRKGLSEGTIVIPKNRKRKAPKICGIGRGLRTKINANIGTSKDSSDIAGELRKLEAAVALGADAVMDLSTGAAIGATRKKILEKSPVPVGTVPIYEIAISGLRRFGSVRDIPAAYMLGILESQAKEGVDFFTIHAGVTRKALGALKRKPRICSTERKSR